MPSHTLPFDGCRAVSARKRGVADACAVLFVLVPSGKVHCRKALLVSGLHGLHATLGPVRCGAEQRPSPAPGPRRPSEPGPPRRTRRGHPEHMRSEQAHRPARSQQPPSIRATGADDSGESQVGNGAALEDLDPLTRSEMTRSRTTETAHGKGWLPSCRWREPAYPMCYMGLAKGRCAPPSIPRLPAPLPGARPSGRPSARSSLEVLR